MVSSSDIKVEKAEFADIDILLKICKEAASTSHGTVWYKDYPYRAILEHDHSIGGLYKILYQGKILGLFALGDLKEFRDDFPPEKPGTKICDMARFGLVPELQGTGISFDITQIAQKLAFEGGYDVVRMFACAKQKSVAALYEFMGFHCVARAYRWGEEMLCFQKSRLEVLFEKVV